MTNTISYPLQVASKQITNKNKKTWAHRHREQIGDQPERERRFWLGKMGDGCQKVQTSSYQINGLVDILYSMVTIVNDTVGISEICWEQTFLKIFKNSWFTMFQMYRWVVRLYQTIHLSSYLTLLRFFSIIGYYKSKY